MRKPKRVRRQIFVLTLDEKKAVACIVGALILGVATMRYRAAHPRVPAPPNAREQATAKRIEKTTAARSRAARSKTIASARTTPAPVAEDDGEE